MNDKNPTVPCPNGCGKKFSEAEAMTEHLQKKCKYRADSTSSRKGLTGKFKIRKRDME